MSVSCGEDPQRRKSVLHLLETGEHSLAIVRDGGVIRSLCQLTCARRFPPSKSVCGHLGSEGPQVRGAVKRSPIAAA